MFSPPQINHESGVRLIRGHRHLEASSGYRLVQDIIARCRNRLHSDVIYRPSIQLMQLNVFKSHFSEKNLIYN